MGRTYVKRINGHDYLYERIEAHREGNKVVATWKYRGPVSAIYEGTEYQRTSRETAFRTRTEAEREAHEIKAQRLGQEARARIEAKERESERRESEKFKEMERRRRESPAIKPKGEEQKRSPSEIAEELRTGQRKPLTKPEQKERTTAIEFEEE